MNEIPILYSYLYRNFKLKKGNVIEVDEAIHIIRSVVRKAPNIIYRKILDELIEYQLLQKINRDKYQILNNPKYIKQVERLMDYIFPITP